MDLKTVYEGEFNAYLLWPFLEKLIFAVVAQSTALLGTLWYFGVVKSWFSDRIMNFGSLCLSQWHCAKVFDNHSLYNWDPHLQKKKIHEDDMQTVSAHHLGMN